MESKLKSAFIKVIAGSLLALSLTACDDLGLPHVFGNNEVPQDVLDQPRLVAVPTEAQQDNATWPRLGDVQSKPKIFSTQTQIEKNMFDMQEDRAEGHDEMKEYEDMKASIPPTLPPSDIPPQTLPQTPSQVPSQMPTNFLQPPAN